MSDFDKRFEPAELLLSALRDPRVLNAIGANDWDVLIRTARAARLLGVLGHRIESANHKIVTPIEAREQFVSERRLAEHRAQMARWELDRVAQALAPLDVPLVALKGAGYLISGAPVAAGRIFSDADILVPRDSMNAVEQRLLAAGWAHEDLDAYDDRYYRQWSHEIPPLRFTGSPIELDVHHAIVPPQRRVQPDMTQLMDRSARVPGSMFRVLSPSDQVLHASLHCMFDSDCTNRLRDLVDIDGLLREWAVDSPHWDALMDTAVRFGAARYVWYALAFARLWLNTPVPSRVEASLASMAPSFAGRHTIATLMGRTILPPHPDRGYGSLLRMITHALQMRSMWLRFPPAVFVVHMTVRPFRGLLSKFGKAHEAEAPA